MTSVAGSAEARLGRLLERLLFAAEASLDAGDLGSARATAEEVRAVDPDNPRAAAILKRTAAHTIGPLGERALITLMFSDLVGSTMLSEHVEPEQVRDLFSVYRAAARKAVTRYGGRIIQYLGDGVLAGFGYPEAHEDDARRAVLAGLDLVAAMRDAQADLENRVGLAPDVRVGIHTGWVVVTDLRQDRASPDRDSIVGVVPNLSARIQQAAEPGTIVISDVTHHLVDADFYMHTLGERELKGISRPVEIFAVERPRHAGARFDADRYKKAGLIGREAPRTELLTAWERVRTMSGQKGPAFLVIGEAGIGKSRLVAEVVDRVAVGEGVAISAACLPYYSNVSLWPMSQLLEQLVGVQGSTEPRLDPLVNYLTSIGLDPEGAVPFLGPLIGVTASDAYPPPLLEPSAFLEETFDRIVEWLTALGRQTPHLLIVEDLHWSDPSTLALLEQVIEQRLPSVLLLGTARDDVSAAWPRASVTVVELGRLDDEASERLVDSLATTSRLSDDERAAIVAQADGIPLFVEELTQSYLDESGTKSIPLRLQEVFTWRLSAPGIDQRVVQVAATVGATFDPNTVTAVVGDSSVVAEQLEILAREGIIEPGDSMAATHRFRHALMRDAAYETQVLDVRRKSHALVAEAIEQQGSEPALVAQHLDLAGEFERASGLYLLAGQSEQARGAHVEAARLLSRALELLDNTPESEEYDLRKLTALMLRASSVSSMQGYAAPAVESDHRRAEALATRLRQRPEVMPSLMAIWSYWLVHGDVASARATMDRLAGMVKEDVFSWFAPEVETCAGWQDFYAGQFRVSRNHLERAMAGFLARAPEQDVSLFWPLPNDPIAVSQIALSCLSTVQGEADNAKHWESEAIRRAERIGFPRGPFSLAFVKTFAAWNRRFIGDFADSWRLGAEVVAIGQEHGYALWTALGSAYAPVGDPGGTQHREFLRQVIDSLRLMGQESFAAANLGYLAQLHAAVDEFDSALELVGQALGVVDATGEELHRPELLRQRAVYALALGDDGHQAVGDLVEAIRVATGQEARIARLRASVELARVPAWCRPDDWRAILEQARSDIPPNLANDDTAAADALLG